jgi:hypothetical protein
VKTINRHRIIAAVLLTVLLVLGVFKDSITPDYLNSPSAYFLNPNHPGYLGVWPSHVLQPSFWIIAYGYSLLHILIPFLIIKLVHGNIEAKYTLYLLIFVFAIQYGIIFTNIEFLVTKLLTKVNRYFHSPLLSFILIAGFTLVNKNESD